MSGLATVKLLSALPGDNTTIGAGSVVSQISQQCGAAEILAALFAICLDMHTLCGLLPIYF